MNPICVPDRHSLSWFTNKKFVKGGYNHKLYLLMEYGIDISPPKGRILSVLSDWKTKDLRSFKADIDEALEQVALAQLNYRADIRKKTRIMPMAQTVDNWREWLKSNSGTRPQGSKADQAYYMVPQVTLSDKGFQHGAVKQQAASRKPQESP